MPPLLLTFDIFGTVVDWRRGLRADLARLNRTLSDEDFERVINAQAMDESGPFRTYRDITAASLVEVLGLTPEEADALGANVGKWPLYPDAREGLRRLLELAPCIAMTNSDRAHGDQVQEQLGFRLSEWVCAEEVRFYKPNPEFWRLVGRRQGVEPGLPWWHVSAYADYDLEAAQALGLTTVFVARAHARPGPATYRVPDLAALIELTQGERG